MRNKKWNKIRKAYQSRGIKSEIYTDIMENQKKVATICVFIGVKLSEPQIEEIEKSFGTFRKTIGKVISESGKGE